MKWIKTAASSVEVVQPSKGDAVQVDEMWHLVNEKTKFGSEERFSWWRVALSDGTWVIVLTKV